MKDTTNAENSRELSLWARFLIFVASVAVGVALGHCRIVSGRRSRCTRTTRSSTRRYEEITRSGTRRYKETPR